MDKDNLVQLTTNLYRLTLLFPKKEPLRYKMRELADDILANLVTVQFFSNPGQVESEPEQEGKILEIKKDLKILNSYFEIAEKQNWISPSEMLEVKGGYDRIGEGLVQGEEAPEERTASLLISETGQEIKETFDFNNLDSRKERILDILKERGKSQVWEINRVLPQVSKRTLRRDFQYLLEKGLIQRIGEKNDTFYQIKS